MSDGLLDTNLIVHAGTADEHGEECRQFLRLVEQGRVRVRLEPVVLHELTYVLPRLRKQMDRAEVAEYLTGILSWPGVEGDKELMVDALSRWGATAGIGFVDAYLAALASRDHCPVYTKNVRDLAGQGVDVPDPLPVS